MNTFIESILPVLITGAFTFLITKYSYYKNVPLDKMEIAYNRIYYPLYKLISTESMSNNVDLDSIIYKASFYFKKYNKYVNRSTLNAFILLRKYKDDESYQNFKNNIQDNNAYLRRRLGYLEPNILKVYSYSSQKEKSHLRLPVEVGVGSLLLCFGNGLNEINNTIVQIKMIIFIAGFILYIIAALEGISMAFKYFSDIKKNKQSY